MFDLDLIEQDWKNNSFCLSEEDIIEIYRLDGATLNKYEEELDEYMKKVNSCCRKEQSTEERLLLAIFGDRETLEEKEKRQKMIDEIPVPQKKHLSKSLQKKVVEGSLYLVFDETRYWYNFFEGKLSLEKIYYICLEALMNSVKYIVHCEKPVFGFYVSKSIERNIIKYVAQYLHITYREVYEMVHYKYEYGAYSSSKQLNKDLNLLFNTETKEEVEKPSQIYYRLRNECYGTNYIKTISSNEFMVDYNMALENLNDVEKIVMQLSFDINGYRGLTNAEIADYLGTDKDKISIIRRRAIKVLRKNAKLNTYL